MGARTVYTKGKYTVKKTNHGYVVINNKEDYSHHSHFENLKGASRCLDLIYKRVLPNNEWWREALRRLLSEEEFKELRADKQNKYYNVGGGKGVRYGRV
jgi:hypothetical protein